MDRVTKRGGVDLEPVEVRTGPRPTDLASSAAGERRVEERGLLGDGRRQGRAAEPQGSQRDEPAGQWYRETLHTLRA